jgi:CheY-like chemotaxis protein
MTREVQQRLFEPFYTTTGAGKGTGLGLATVHGLGSLGARVLGAFGYKVLVARTGADASRIVAEHPGPIDLVATDVVMPEMSGGQLVEKVLKARPGIRVLYMSGYTDDEVMRRGVIDGLAFLAPRCSL